MSRPKPSILLNHVDPRTCRSEQVLRASAIYAVFLDGQPVNLRSIHTHMIDAPKYKKSSFSNSGHAFNLAEKLNKLFKTDRFSVHMLTSGPMVVESIE